MSTETDESGIERVSTLDILQETILAVLGDIRMSKIRLSEEMTILGDNFSKYEDDVINIIANQSKVDYSLSLIREKISYVKDNLSPLKLTWSKLVSRVLLGYYNSTGELTGNGQVLPQAGWLGGVIVNTDGANDARLVLYDSLEGSGTELYRVYLPGGDNQAGIFFGTKPLQFLNGCTRKLWGNNANCIIK